MESRTDLFFKIIFTLILGTVGSLWYLSHNKRCKNLVQQKIVLALERDYGISFSGKLSSLSFIKPALSFTDVTCHPILEPQQWSLSAKELTLSLSMVKLLIKRSFFISVDASSVTLFSQVKEGSVCFVQGLQKIFAKPATLSVHPDRCSCFSWVVHLEEEQGKWKALLGGDVQVVREATGYKIALILLQGEAQFDQKVPVSQLAGTVEMVLPFGKTPDLTVNLGAYLPFVLGAHERCYLTGRWADKEGQFSCVSDQGSFVCKPISVVLEKGGPRVNIAGDISLATCMQAAQLPYTQQVSGRCSFGLEGTVGGTLSGTVSLREGRLAGWMMEHATTSFVINPAGIEGTFSYHQQTEQLKGSWTWNNRQKQLCFDVTNITPFTLFATQWYLPGGKTYCKGCYSPSKGGVLTYACACEQAKTEEQLTTEGTVTWTQDEIKNNGMLYLKTGTYAMQTIASWAQGPFLLTVRDSKDEATEPVILIERQGTEIQTRLELSFIQKLLSEYAQSGVITQGTLLMTGTWQGPYLRGSIMLTNGIVRRPETYNFMHGLQADFSCNILKRLLTVKNLKISLQKGVIKGACLKIGYDPVLKGMWAHLPLTFSDCFINWKKDLYILLSGAVVGKKNPHEDPSIEGFVVLDKAQLKENIFSQKTQDLLLNSWGDSSGRQKISIHIALTSRSPVSVKTEQLETEALLSLELSTPEGEHEVQGTITLQGGAIHFPAHSLSIVKGKLIFVREHPQDPFIELVAQARIKKYLVTLSIGGTGQDPQLLFDSVPALSEEQIMMLLLSGSEEESFNIAAPALIMRNMEKIIFGSSYRSRHDSWLEPLKRIRFVPRFTDQTGRGGFKGALEIEVSKKLRAMIEKNFSLTEDVAYEVEYLLADDVSLRASCDERGDLGGEIEMRFKF